MDGQPGNRGRQGRGTRRNSSYPRADGECKGLSSWPRDGHPPAPGGACGFPPESWEFIITGFTLDEERLKQGGGGNRFDELLARIRDIRSSGKVRFPHEGVGGDPLLVGNPQATRTPLDSTPGTHRRVSGQGPNL